MPARYRVEITPTAEEDLENIWDHIASDSVRAATRFVLGLEEQIATLERMPERCPSIPENDILGTEYRHMIFDDYRVVFRVSGRAVHVLRVVHGNRLLDTSYFGGG